MKSKRRVPVWLGFIIAVVGFAAGLFLAPLAATIALVVLVTGIVAMAKNTPTWLRFRSRTTATWATIAAAVVFFGCGTITSVLYPTEPSSVAANSTPTRTPVSASSPADAQTAESHGDASTATDASAAAGTALAVLSTLEVKGRAPATGYDRDQFGQRWLDVDRNGCDSRNDTLARDLADVVRSGPCKVVSGILLDPYTGEPIAFQRGQGTSELVQVDHVVSLSDAWAKGAQLQTPDQRATFANDPLNLLAVDGDANAQKSDGDAATWLPRNKAFRCEFVARQVSVKATYDLWVTAAERDAIARVLADCPDELALVSEFAAPAPTVPAPESTAPAPVPFAPAPVPFAPAPEAPAPVAPAPVASAPVPAPAPPASTHYANCDAVRAAGAAPIRSTDPGYSRKLDRDGDGIACE